ncbi:zinc-ribbon domain-containing protein [Lactiplantibacillus plantarum]|uniref:zinc-ribbon domain-containing protein n=1 Tax=Lactiplantibacillus plantarum TaxID=1590 RepID=UPI003C141621
MKICPNCQHENEADNVFCENCGADLTHIDSAERTQASGTEQKLGDSRQYQAHKPAKTAAIKVVANQWKRARSRHYCGRWIWVLSISHW